MCANHSDKRISMRPSRAHYQSEPSHLSPSFTSTSCAGCPQFRIHGLKTSITWILPATPNVARYRTRAQRDSIPHNSPGESHARLPFSQRDIPAAKHLEHIINRSNSDRLYYLFFTLNLEFFSHYFLSEFYLAAVWYFLLNFFFPCTAWFHMQVILIKLNHCRQTVRCHYTHMYAKRIGISFVTF